MLRGNKNKLIRKIGAPEGPLNQAGQASGSASASVFQRGGKRHKPIPSSARRRLRSSADMVRAMSSLSSLSQTRRTDRKIADSPFTLTRPRSPDALMLAASSITIIERRSTTAPQTALTGHRARRV